ncbi:MAG: transglutaminase domain-containing protein [Sphingobacteriaceae bacterium]|nr:transglutaminase domain-containing protein [Sphingobacteriaceae bacterium]
MFVQVLLLGLPTVVYMAMLLFNLNSFYAILENKWFNQSLYFLFGLWISLVFYAFKFRFLTTSALLLLLNAVIYKGLGSISIGEFDAFYYSIEYLIFSLLFTLGWFCGYGFSRSRYFTILLSILFLIIQIVLLSKTSVLTATALMNAGIPVLAYSFYIIYTAELIRNMNEDETRFAPFLFKRVFGFAILLLFIFLAVFNWFGPKFTAIEKEWGGSSTQTKNGNSGGESMTEKGKDGGVKNKDQSKLAGSLNKDKQLIFVARLDNYFYDNRTPNPLYFTSHYYTKFDTATQTFEIDKDIPYNDLFKPDPSQIPMYFRLNEQQYIKNSLAIKNRKIVSADIYKVFMSPSEFVAPSTAFYCQPVSVPKEYREQYKSAYTAKMWVSELNSAYFIYNPAGNYQLERFQESRFEALREIKQIKGPDKKFMNYYTYMPKDAEYKKITRLADSVTAEASTPIDKIIAIRDYFLSKDQFDQPLYKYSDNPGIPGLPSANKLTYFLFENRKGYCAYFAGATLFMLRSLGIPSRVVAGYSITDRSSKNPGWYWFYQDQAHAWVQVFFQDYGWIDFDTTIPDLNTQQASQPDGTPPTDMPQTYFVADGEVISCDTVQKNILLKTSTLLYHDTEFVHVAFVELDLDVKMANFISDTGQVQIHDVKKGDRITAVSHAEVLKTIYTSANDKFMDIVRKIPSPVPIDEIKLMHKEQKKEEVKKKEEEQKTFNWMLFLKYTGLLLLVFAICFGLSPVFIWMYLNTSAKSEKKNSVYKKYRALTFYLNQFNYYPEKETPLEFAGRIDSKFESDFTKFSKLYQKHKYSPANCTEEELQDLANTYSLILKDIRKHFKLQKRILPFFNVYNTIRFFTKPKIN